MYLYLTNIYSDCLKFSHLRKKCKCLSNRLSNHDYKFFWKCIKTLKINKSSIPSSVILDGIVADNTSKLFASYFFSVYSDSNIMIVNQELLYTNNYIDLNLNACVITETELLDTFGSLSEVLGAVSDGLPPIFLKSCLSVLIKPLYYLLNLSLNGGVSIFLEKIV